MNGCALLAIIVCVDTICDRGQMIVGMPKFLLCKQNILVISLCGIRAQSTTTEVKEDVVKDFKELGSGH